MKTRGKELLELVVWSQQRVAQERWLKNIASRVNRAAWVERAIPFVYATQLAASSEFQRAFIDLRQIRIRLEMYVQAALQSFEVARGQRDGHEFDHCVRQCATEVGQWDLRFATLIADHLLPGTNVFRVLDDGFTPAGRREKLTRDYCESSLVELREAAPLDDQPDRYVIVCPSSGDRESWRADEVRLIVGSLAPMHPSTRAELKIAFSISGVDPLTLLSAGQLVVVAFDGGKRKVYFRQVAQAAVRPYEFAVPIPSWITADLHTLWVAYVHGLDVTFQPRRWPALRVVNS